MVLAVYSDCGEERWQRLFWVWQQWVEGFFPFLTLLSRWCLRATYAVRLASCTLSMCVFLSPLVVWVFRPRRISLSLKCANTTLYQTPVNYHVRGFLGYKTLGPIKYIRNRIKTVWDSNLWIGLNSTYQLWDGLWYY